MAFSPRKYFQKASIRDSDNLVKPFMQVAIQTTRYYAHDVNLFTEINEIKDFVLSLFVNLHIAMKFGLYLNKKNLGSSYDISYKRKYLKNFLNSIYFYRVVSEDSRIKIYFSKYNLLSIVLLGISRYRFGP